MATQPPELTISAAYQLVRDDALFQRGRALAEQGAVVQAWRRGMLLLAHVQGGEVLPYSVTVEAPPRGKRRWATACTCAFYEIYNALCKHAAAVLFLWATRPDTFTLEPTLDEELAGKERTRWQQLIQGSLRNNDDLERLLELPPERKRPLRRAVQLAPFEEQLRYALLPTHEPAKQVQLARSVLESAAGYQRVGDSANGIRIASLLAERLIESEGKPFARLLRETFLLLELAALTATWEEGEQGAWLGQLFVWWGHVTEKPEATEPLLDLILHTYTPETEGQVIAWLRAQLRRPIHANQRSQQGWRERIRTYLLTYYETRTDNDALLDLCWEEGDDRRAAITLARQGDGAEAAQLARGGLGDATTHRLVAELLAEQGEQERARQVAEAGRGYHDRGRAALLTWLAQEGYATGATAQAWEDAFSAWQLSPTPERYRLLRLLNPAEEKRAELLTSLDRQGKIDVLVEILTDEGHWEDAAARLAESGVRRAELTERLARAVSETEPALALRLLFDLADSHARTGTKAGYAQAVRALLAAQTVAERQEERVEFAVLLQNFRDVHKRRTKLVASIVENGIE